MKPFDLEAAKAGAPVCTQDGRPVRILCWDLNSVFPIVAARESLYTPEEIVLRYTREGVSGPGQDSQDNLCMSPVKTQVWVNAYKDSDRAGGGVWFGSTYHTEDQAKSSICPLAVYLGTHMLEWED